jgi:acetyl esterase/lipase
MRRVIFVFVGMAFSCLSTTGDLSEGAPEGEVYTYKKQGGVAHEIEIHFPKDHDRSKPVPGIIMFHGGGWSKGDRISFRYLCHYFASRGLVAATANYRLGKGKAPLHH